MANALKALEQIIGMEDLFALGGFVEETARKTIKEAWDSALPEIAVQMGAGHWRASSLGKLSQIISETIAAYKGDSEVEDLYLVLMDKAEAFFANQQKGKEESYGYTGKEIEWNSTCPD